MKELITYILICFGVFQSAYSQTYLQGYEVIQLSDAANSNLLFPSKRLTTNEAYTKLTEVVSDPFEKSEKDVVGESWLIDNLLVTIVTRKITANRPKENLNDTQKSYAPEVRYREGTVPDRTRAKDYFSEIKHVNNFEVLVDYFKTRSPYKRFLIQDNEGKFKIMGTVYVEKKNGNKAHKLVDKILNSLYFKD